jgi:hypothetical protein
MLLAAGHDRCGPEKVDHREPQLDKVPQANTDRPYSRGLKQRVSGM